MVPIDSPAIINAWANLVTDSIELPVSAAIDLIPSLILLNDSAFLTTFLISQSTKEFVLLLHWD